MQQGSTYKLSAQQYEIWLSCQIEPGKSYKWIIVNEKRFKGNIDIHALLTAWKKLLTDHEILRAGFIMIDRKPFHQIHQTLPNDCAFEFLDLSHLSESEVKSQTEKIFNREFIYNWDLKNIVCRLVVIKNKDNEYTSFLRSHHLIADGKSIILMWQELGRLYTNICNGEPDKATLLGQYVEFIDYQEGLRQKGNFFEKVLGYWTNKYATPQAKLSLIPDYTGTSDANAADSEIIKIKSAELKTFSFRQRLTLSSVVLSAFYFILYRYSNQTDITIGVYFTGRNLQQLHENIIGTFINTVPLRFNLSNDIPIRKLLQEVYKTLVEANENQHIAFNELKKIAKVSDGDPLFSVGFNYSKLETGPIFSGIETIAHEVKAAQVIDNDLTLRVYESNSFLEIRLDYNKKKFSNERIKLMLNNMTFVMDTMKSELDTPLNKFNGLTPAEKKKIDDFSFAPSGYPKNTLIHELFEENARLYSSCIAVVAENYLLTYRQLNEKAENLAFILSERGIDANISLPVIVDHSPALIISLLAIMKIGATYVPVDSTWPPDRIKDILNDLGARFVLTDNIASGAYAGLSPEQLIMINIDELSSVTPGKFTRSSRSVNDPFYIMYTSGSTGSPKGVIISQKGILNRLFWMNDYFGKESAQATILTTRYVYDSSIWQLLWPLINGGKTVIVPSQLLLSPSELINIIYENEVRTVDFVPSVFAFVLKELNQKSNLQQNLKHIINIIIGGEEINTHHVLQFKEKFPAIRLFNLYGPTEASIGCIAYEVTGNEKGKIPIGKPITNARILILDNELQITPVGVAGEIYIGGDCVGIGYFNNPEKTEASFITLKEHGNSVFYKSGDLGIWSHEGNIFFLGRNDQQIKLRGFRIEPAEIINQFYSFGDIEHCVITVVENDSDKYLCAYFVARSEINIIALKDFLHQKLPKYAIPKVFIPVPAIPVTAAGKTDYSKLPRPIENIPISQVSPVSDTNQHILIQIWSKVLNLDPAQIVTTHNFFELGGHSLNAIEVLSLVYQYFKIDIPITLFFKSPDIRSMCEFINSGENRQAITKANKKIFYPLSAKQRRVYILHHLDDKGILYNMPATFRITGHLNVEGLIKSLQKIIERHDILRSYFLIKEMNVVQIIKEQVTVDFTHQRILKIKTDEYLKTFIKPFNLTIPSLMRAGLLTVSEEEHIMVIDIHHIIADGISYEIIMNELAILYNGGILPNPRFQYTDIVEFEYSAENVINAAKTSSFWENALSCNLPVLNIPTDFDRPAVRKFDAKRISIEINGDLLALIRGLAKQEQQSTFAVFFSCFNILLAAFGKTEDVIVGVPVSGRVYPETKDIIGLFANTLPLRNYPIGSKTFTQFLSEVKNNISESLKYQDFELDKLVQKLPLSGDRSRNPVYDVVFSYQNEYVNKIDFKSLSVERYAAEEEIFTAAKLDISCWCKELNDKIIIKAEYSTALFKPETIKKLLNSYVTILTSVTKERNITINDLINIACFQVSSGVAAN